MTVRKLEPGEYWFDDLRVGDHFATSAINVTEAHVVNFAGISGDLFDVHMDEEFARELGFPGRIAHGLLGLALTDGLKTRCPVRTKSVATLNWNWSFVAPIFIGDRIHVHLQVRALRLTKRGDRGIVTLAIQTKKQDGSIVQEGETLLLVLAKSGTTAS
jgi:acyl dehydratase